MSTTPSPRTLLGIRAKPSNPCIRIQTGCGGSPRTGSRFHSGTSVKITNPKSPKFKCHFLLAANQEEAGGKKKGWHNDCRSRRGECWREKTCQTGEYSYLLFFLIIYSNFSCQIKRPLKEMPDTLPQHSSKPKNRMTEAMKACNEIIKEMFSKKHSAYAWPFYKPVDTEQLDLHDYKQVSGFFVCLMLLNDGIVFHHIRSYW